MSGFRLAVLERLRAQQLQLAVRALHVANQQLIAARGQRADLAFRLGRGMPPATRTADQLAQGATYRELLRAQLLAADKQIDELAAVLAGCRQDWLSASAQVRAVEALHERYRSARRTVAARRDQKELDELAGTRPTREAVTAVEVYP